MRANLAALRTLRELQRQGRAASDEERRTLARWSSWGAVQQIFDETRPEWALDSRQLKELVDEEAYAAARRTTINAHYTDPLIARQVCRTAMELGFSEGRVLEPGVGAGVFVGLAPAGARVTGVELDPTTAAITAAIYPHASIRVESFAQTPLPEGHFDLVVGNVPFADVRLHDPRHNRGGHTQHNHFIIKSLALTRPGGLVVVLSSHFTMDAGNPAARREIAGLADLMGAVRLPSGAHRRAAGTEALTDLLVLRRRPRDAEPAGAAWETTRRVAVDGGEARVNAYFLEHPEHVLGVMLLAHGMHSAQTLHVRPRDEEADLGEQLRVALASVADRARAKGLTMTPRPPGHDPTTGDAPGEPVIAERLWDGHIAARADGTFTTVAGTTVERLAVPRSQAMELRALLELREGARRLLAAEAATAEDTPELDDLRRQLRDGYRRYVTGYGPINRQALRPTGRIDSATGAQRLARITPQAVRTLRSDPFAALVLALEVFDEATQTATPAALLTRRAVVPRTPPLSAETPQDALAIWLENHGRVDLEGIARLLSVEHAEARESLGELVYEDPDTRRPMPAAEYLSGNVRSKLEAARTAAAATPAWG